MFEVQSTKLPAWRAWLLAIRLKTLTASIAPVICGAVISWEFFPLQISLTAILLLYAISLQVLSNLSNDYCDHFRGIDTPNRIGPVRVTNSGLISPEKMKLAMWLNVIFILILGAYLGTISSFWIFIITLIAIASAYLYSGGPKPYGSMGLGELFVFIFFGPITVIGTYYILTKQFSLDALVLGISLGFISSALLVVNNIRDYEQDKFANKRTLVVRFGKFFGQMEYLILILLAAIIPWFDEHLVELHPYSLISTTILLFAIPSFQIVFKHKSPVELNSVMAKTAAYIILFGLFFGAGFFFHD